MGNRVEDDFVICSHCNGVITSAEHHSHATFLREDYETWCLSCITKEPQVYAKNCLLNYQWDYLQFDFSKCEYELFRKGKSYHIRARFRHRL